MKMIQGKIPSAKKTVVYGPEGIGKSTFASQFPDPVFIDTEGSTKDMDVTRFERPESWQMLLDEVRHVKEHPDVCRTLVVDTADWAEMLCMTQVCDRNHKGSIEEFSYGKGYVYVQEEFGRLLNLLEEVVKAGIHVVLTAHAKMRKFEQPDELGAYDRWEMKLTKQTAPMVKEWADMVLFANYKTFVVNVDGQGAQKGKNKVQGGARVMYTSHHPCWDAKNRYGLPEELPFSYDAIRHILEAAPDIQAPKMVPETGTPAPTAPPAPAPAPQEAVQQTMDFKAMEPREQEMREAFSVDPRVPKALRDLMMEYRVTEWEIETACEAKGYVPAGTPLYEYEDVNPGFISGCLVAAWPQVFAMVKEIRDKEAVPFD